MLLHEMLINLHPDVQAVYFQPPNGLKMQYPCIVYERDDANTIYADNKPLITNNRYLITIIDRNPESGISKVLETWPLCSFSRSFAGDNLNHDVYNLYF